MSANPHASSDTLSASQQQLLTSVQQLQNAQRDLMYKYAAATDPTERTNIANEMDKNEMLRSNLLSSSGAAALVQNQVVDTKRAAAADLTAMTNFVEVELKSARDQLEEIQTSRTGKERMIQLNTYYGKRFMAQAGVMKIFIYMCIPILILAILANMGFLPNYIAGFAIIASIVVGIVYIYGAVHDINRRDKMNFDEYTWEFDPSRVGPIVHPHHHHKKKDSAGEQCPNVCDVQGDNSAVKGTSQTAGKTGAMSIANTAAPATAPPATGLLGDLSNPTAITAAPTPAAPTQSQQSITVFSNLQPCVQSGVTVPGWSADPNNSGYCIAPSGQKCCNKSTYNGQPVCQAGFGADNYDENAMNGWIAGCITPQVATSGPTASTAPTDAPTPTSFGCTKCSDPGMFSCTNLPQSNPLKGGGIIPANTPSLISNYMMNLYDLETPAYTLEGNNYWWRQEGGCI